MSKSVDERLNEMEDTLNRVKDALNHNTKVSRAKAEADQKGIEALKSRVDQLERSKPNEFNIDDLFKGAKK